MIFAYLLELTISFESMIDQAHHRKLAKYNDLLEAVKMVAKTQSALPLRSGQEVS